jgi:hypothetical protein
MVYQLSSQVILTMQRTLEDVSSPRSTQCTLGEYCCQLNLLAYCATYLRAVVWSYRLRYPRESCRSLLRALLASRTAISPRSSEDG